MYTAQLSTAAAAKAKALMKDDWCCHDGNFVSIVRSDGCRLPTDAPRRVHDGSLVASRWEPLVLNRRSVVYTEPMRPVEIFRGMSTSLGLLLLAPLIQHFDIGRHSRTAILNLQFRSRCAVAHPSTCFSGTSKQNVASTETLFVPGTRIKRIRYDRRFPFFIVDAISQRALYRHTLH